MYGFEQKFMSGAAMNSRRQSLRLSIIGSATARRFKFIKKKIAMLLVVSGLAIGATTMTQAAVTVTAATGGTNVSADRAQNGAAPAFITLGNIVIQEGANGDFATGSNRTLILTAPSGWQFNPGVGSATGSNVSGSGGNEISVNSISVTATTITVTYSVSGTGQINRLTIGGIQVRPTEGGNLPAAGNLLRTSANPGTASINGITNGVTSFGSLSQAVGALRLYVVLPGQTFTDAATLAASGLSVSPANQTAGVAFNLAKLLAADRQFNLDSSYAGTKTINYSGPAGSPTYTTSVTFSSGQSTTTLATTLTLAETTTLTASDGTNPGVTSSSFIVNAGTFTKLQLLVPGETAAPGTYLTQSRDGRQDSQSPVDRRLHLANVRITHVSCIIIGLFNLFIFFGG